jgi:hypothetical protein
MLPHTLNLRPRRGDQPINHVTVAEEHAMKLPRLLALAAILSAFPAASTPAGGASGAGETCGLPIAIQDPDIRAAFARFEQNQSGAAAKACAYFRKDASGTL